MLARIVGEDQGIEIERLERVVAVVRGHLRTGLQYCIAPPRKRRSQGRLKESCLVFFYYFFFESLNGGEERIPLKEASI